MSENRKDCPTPETKIDRQLRAGEAMYRGGYIAKLECQLAEANEETARLKKALSNASAIYDAAFEQRDRLADLLNEADAYIHTCPFKARIRMALDSVKGGKQCSLNQPESTNEPRTASPSLARSARAVPGVSRSLEH